MTYSIIPGTGWEATYRLDTPHPNTVPIVAWRCNEDGYTEALIHTPEGDTLAFPGDGITAKVHPAGTRPLPIARLVAIPKFNETTWDFEIKCPRCADTHLHSAGTVKTREAFTAILGRRAAHCPQQSFTYVMADPDNIIGKTLA